MSFHFGLILLLVAVVQSGTVNNTMEEDNYEPNEFVEEGPNVHSKNGSRLIFPGTKWCGPGNNADGDDDLGHFEDTDKCCRAHDHCDGIEAGGSKYGLQNDSPYTKLHCGCDKAFYKCLKQVDEFQAHMIGEMYFIGNEKCYKKAHPIIDCESYEVFLWMRRCKRYKVDVNQPKVYQYFDLPFYDLDNTHKRRNACYRTMITPSNVRSNYV